MGTVFRGLVAGAAGTAALNIVTYLDMAVRARPASATPEEGVQHLAERAGVDLGEGKPAENRKAGLGPLLGYATGMGTAVGYALLVRPRLPRPVAAALLTTLAITGSNLPMARLGITDPRRWTATEWLSDLVPHLAYGIVTAAVDDRLR